jgi:hypothetical protein
MDTEQCCALAWLISCLVLSLEGWLTGDIYLSKSIIRDLQSTFHSPENLRLERKHKDCVLVVPAERKVPARKTKEKLIHAGVGRGVTCDGSLETLLHDDERRPTGYRHQSYPWEQFA